MYYENFQKLCETRDVKPAAVSRATGISTATLTSWKQGKYTPKPDKLQKIADFFGVTLDFLMSGNFDTKKGYYINEEAAEMAQELFENKEMRILFDAAKGATAEDLRTAADVLLALKRKEKQDGNDQT